MQIDKADEAERVCWLCVNDMASHYRPKLQLAFLFGLLRLALDFLLASCHDIPAYWQPQMLAMAKTPTASKQ